MSEPLECNWVMLTSGVVEWYVSFPVLPQIPIVRLADARSTSFWISNWRPAVLGWGTSVAWHRTHRSSPRQCHFPPPTESWFLSNPSAAWSWTKQLCFAERQTRACQSWLQGGRDEHVTMQQTVLSQPGKAGMMAEEGRNPERVIVFEKGYNIQLYTCELNGFSGRQVEAVVGILCFTWGPSQTTAAQRKGAVTGEGIIQESKGQQLVTLEWVNCLVIWWTMYLGRFVLCCHADTHWNIRNMEIFHASGSVVSHQAMHSRTIPLAKAQ